MGAGKDYTVHSKVLQNAMGPIVRHNIFTHFSEKSFGGLGCSRYGNRLSVVSVLILRANKLLSKGCVQYKLESCSLTWGNVRAGEEIASVSHH